LGIRIDVHVIRAVLVFLVVVVVVVVVIFIVRLFRLPSPRSSAITLQLDPHATSPRDALGSTVSPGRGRLAFDRSLALRPRLNRR
jgi:hypothetical protein